MAGFENGSLRSFVQKPMFHNIGFKYSSPTFTICGSDGRDLNEYNPGYLSIPSKTNNGLLKNIKITRNYSFTDGSSGDISGNLFGVYTGAVTANVLFGVYAVLNDDEDDIEFMLGRIPNTHFSPAASKIGAPDDAVANLQSDFWCFNNIDETLYDENPCLAVGTVTMIKDGSDDWTMGVYWPDSNGSDSGVGFWGNGRAFFLGTQQFGAASQSHFRSNGGSAPTGGGSYTYTINYFNQTVIVYYTSNAFTASGTGAVEAQLVLPYIVGPNSGTTYTYYNSAGVFFDSSAGTWTNATVKIGSSQKVANFILSGATTTMLNTDLQINDIIGCSFEYKISVNE